MTYVHGNLVFGRLKQEFPVDQRVAFGRTGEDELDQQTGVVYGKGIIDGVCDFYIVVFDTPYKGNKATVITEACLCPIE